VLSSLSAPHWLWGSCMQQICSFRGGRYFPICSLISCLRFSGRLSSSASPPAPSHFRMASSGELRILK
jgi:hypothetical protein